MAATQIWVLCTAARTREGSGVTQPAQPKVLSERGSAERELGLSRWPTGWNSQPIGQEQPMVGSVRPAVHPVSAGDHEKERLAALVAGARQGR